MPPPPPTTTSPPAPPPPSPPPQHPSINTLPSLPAPPSWTLPAALLTLALSVLATTLAYRLTFPRRAATSHDRDHRILADDEVAPRFATAPRRRTRIQRIWEERRGERVRGAEGETVLPPRLGRWGDGTGGGEGARVRGGYVSVPGEEEEGGDEIEVVAVDDEDGWVREESGWLQKVDEGLEWLIEKVAGYLGDEGGEEGLVFPVTEEERGERIG